MQYKYDNLTMVTFMDAISINIFQFIFLQTVIINTIDAIHSCTVGSITTTHAHVWWKHIFLSMLNLFGHPSIRILQILFRIF